VRAKWVKFVRKHRPDFKDPKCTALYSAHFEDDCYEYKSSVIGTIEQSGRVKIRRYIKRTAEPTRDAVVPAAPEEVPSNRMKRHVHSKRYCNRAILFLLREQPLTKTAQKPQNCPNAKTGSY